jgi:hypothetical protein
MVVWQLLLIILSALAMGVILGLFVIRLIRRSQKSHYPFDHLIGQNSANPALVVSTPQVFQSTNSSVSNTEDKLELLMREKQRIAVNRKFEQNIDTGLLEELKHNLSVATIPLKDKLLPFQTDSWDNNQDTLTNDHKEELIQVYTDIRLANVIVWLSNELGHVSPELEQGYIELCSKIAEFLQKLVTT